MESLAFPLRMPMKMLTMKTLALCLILAKSGDLRNIEGEGLVDGLALLTDGGLEQNYAAVR